MTEETYTPMCPCIDPEADESMDHEHYEESRRREYKPLFAKVTWSDGRIDTVPAPCQEVGISPDNMEPPLECIASVTVGHPDSRTQDEATMTVHRLSDDVYWKDVSGESGESTLIRGPIEDVLLDALGDWDGIWPLWDDYLKQVQGDPDADLEEEEGGMDSGWSTVDIYLSKEEEQALISRLMGT